MPLSRRRFLALSAAVPLAACAPDDGADGEPADPSTTSRAGPDPATTSTLPTTSTTSTSEPPGTSEPHADPDVVLDDDPFVFGVSSGEPDSSSVVIWTRLADPIPADGIDVRWEFDGDHGHRDAGWTRTDPSLGGSVHVVIDVPGPGTYRFIAGGHESPSGRTAPIDPDADAFRFVAASCQNFETGFYAAYRDVVDWAPDLVVFLGDFIYENLPFPIEGVSVREHEVAEPRDLVGYRTRYSTYLSDPDLRAARASAPWLVIWDDHEVQNNYAGLVSNDEAPIDEFARRRAAAYRAWWEHMPTRLPSPLADGTGIDPYRTERALDVGGLVSFSALDGRQFRDDQLSDDKGLGAPALDGWDDPSRTVLGVEQEAWIAERFDSAPGRWHCLVQPSMLTDTIDPRDGAIYNYDQWDGYAPARDRLLAAAPPNLVSISGDVHLAAVGLLGPSGRRVGVEFVSTAISSIPSLDPELEEAFVALPDVVDADFIHRGHTRHTVTADRWLAEYRQVVDVSDASSASRTWKTFVVEAGTAEVAEA